VAGILFSEYGKHVLNGGLLLIGPFIGGESPLSDLYDMRLEISSDHIRHILLQVNHVLSIKFLALSDTFFKNLLNSE
jgi:hypothetical protein